MIKINIEDLEKRIKALCLKNGLDEADSKVMTDVYMRATYRGVGHHDIYDFIGRLDLLSDGSVNPKPNIKSLVSFGGLESWDGDNCLGEVGTVFITKRSMMLAKNNGIGFATIRNSNHFLAAAPYVEMADEAGFLTLVMSKSPSGISVPGADKNIIGNNPFGYAAGYGEQNEQILFDICSAYSSFGKMNALAQSGGKIPSYWGNDKDGNPTTNPQDVLESDLYMPIGNHKGFGMAILVELFTAILSGGTILNETEAESKMKGIYTQTAISIDVSKIYPEVTYRERVQKMTKILKTLYPDIYIPGERSASVKSEIFARGYVELEDQLMERLMRD